MARHRSPSGRRAHLGPPLSAAPAAAGVGGAASTPRLTMSQLADAIPLSGPLSRPLRVVAVVVAGGAVAAAGQQALADTLPGVVDGATKLLSSSVSASSAAALDVPADQPAIGSNLLTSPAPSSGVSAGPLESVAAEPQVADAAALVKAAGLQQAAADAAAKAAKAPALSLGGGIQMISGRVTSGFGGRWGTVHEGLDIAAPIGTPIHVPEDGTVISSGPASGFGLWVRVQHPDGTITVYGHINRSFVKVGQQVKAGDVIAETGNRGQSTGPHLHIGVMIDGAYVNPQPWLDKLGIGY